MKRSWFFCFLLSILCWSCASYYTKNQEFNKNFEQANFKKADDILASDKKAEKRKTKLLYYLNRGTTNHMLGNYRVSNEFFEKADRYVETYRANAALTAASFLTNPKMEYYKGEDHERILINYYKALNYLFLNNYEDALVEVRRMNIQLQKLDDKYKGKNKYQKDAFFHLLMGIVYDLNKDPNNAFIAFRNSYEIYESDYKKLFGINTPEQLKRDLLRTGYQSGIDISYYEKQFGFNYSKREEKEASLYYLWHNGLGPYKEEWSINFTLIPGAAGNVTFVNDELGFSFSFPVSQQQKASLSKTSIYRVAFPKYHERELYFTSGKIAVDGGKTQKLELSEDVNQIAFHALKQRMVLELGEALLRLALKKALEYQVRQENESLGALMSIANAVSEQADTRNWQTIPHSIYYTRIPVNEGEHQVSLLQEEGSGNVREVKKTVNLSKGDIQLLTHYSLNYKQ